jgi:hypothetical protein
MFNLTKSNFHCNSFALVSISCITDLAKLSFNVSLGKYFRYGCKIIVFIKRKYSSLLGNLYSLFSRDTEYY